MATSTAKHIETVCSCNRLFNEKTLHPLVSIIDFSNKKKDEDIKLGCYAVMLLTHPSDNNIFGKEKYDFSEATLVFHAPDKTIDIRCSSWQPKEGLLLVFHPDLICGTPLGQKIKDYTFFKYKGKESLHLSARELNFIKREFEDIQTELDWGIDKFSQMLICNNIELLLNHCCRFYNRQFITRHDACEEVIKKLTQSIDNYLKSEKADDSNMPCPCYFSRQFGMSSAYMNDLLRHETGKNFNDYISLRRIDIAKQLLIGTNRTEQEIAKDLGFCTAGRFRQLFMKLTGLTPEDYRK